MTVLICEFWLENRQIEDGLELEKLEIRKTWQVKDELLELGDWIQERWTMTDVETEKFGKEQIRTSRNRNLAIRDYRCA